jgi:hypothetical protein
MNQPHQIQLHTPSNPPCPTQIPAQPIPNPNNNKASHLAYNVELQFFSTFPTYCISPAPLQ